tara:strand:- start:854 stop:1048 length:195 start_codon:yes stop_codon:yes gene_type:complete
MHCAKNVTTFNVPVLYPVMFRGLGKHSTVERRVVRNDKLSAFSHSAQNLKHLSNLWGRFLSFML